MNRYGTFKDKAIGWLKANKVLLIQIGAVIAIAVIVAAIMIPQMAVMPSELKAVVARSEQAVSHVGSEIADLAKAITKVSGDLATTEGKVDELSDTVAEYDDAISGIGTRIDDVEDAMGQIEASAPEAWLTGVAGNYTLHAKGEPGTYTANVWLCYSPPIALNATSYSEAVDAFFGLTDTSAEPYKRYVPTLSQNATGMWVVTAIHFNVGTFPLEEGKVRTVAALYGGLPEPDWAYVEIYPALKKS